LTPDVIKCFGVVLGVFYQDIHHKIGLAMLLGKVCSLLVVSTLTTHGNCCVKIELEVTRRLDKLFKLVDVLELGIAVEEKGSVISSRFSGLM
jgi:hypothetical protein